MGDYSNKRCIYCGMEGLTGYFDHNNKFRLGIKIDVNTYKEHRCVSKTEAPNKITVTHEWCFKCDVPIDLRYPCEHMKPKPMVDTIERAKGELDRFC